MSNNGHQPGGATIGAVPLLQKQQLTHYRLVVLGRDDRQEELSFFGSGYQIDPGGHLHLGTNNVVVQTFAPGRWLSVGRADCSLEQA